jgi:Spc24 subunit of Ndc80
VVVAVHLIQRGGCDVRLAARKVPLDVVLRNHLNVNNEIPTTTFSKKVIDDLHPVYQQSKFVEYLLEARQDASRRGSSDCMDIPHHRALEKCADTNLQLIHHTIDNFNIQPDKLAIGRINESLSTLKQSRDMRIQDAENALRKLSRNLATLSSQHKETISTHDSVSHAAEISELDTKKFRMAKAASEVEIESERLEGELEELKTRLADLEMQGVEGDDQARREREADDATM